MIPPEFIPEMEKRGINVHELPPRNDGDAPTYTVKISVYAQDGKNFVKYEIGDKSYETEVLTNDVTIYVKSSDRVDSEDSNGEIIDLDPLTGKITAKKEGDVVVSAVLKNGTTIKSNTSSYTLHVFAPNEGLDWNRVKTYNYSYNTTQQNTNKDLWIIKNYQTTLNPSHDWSPITLLKTDTYIKQNLDGSDNNSWKQIAAFTTPSVEYYRTICQKIKIDVRVPKYSKAEATYKFAGNVTVANQGNKYTRYGFEIKDLGVVSSEEADNEINSIACNS